MKWTREDIDLNIEKQIITGMIVSESFLKKIYPILSLDFFQSDYSRTIASWCLEYYNMYSKAPGKYIQDIYLTKQDTINDDYRELIELFLTNLSNEYANGDFEEKRNQYTDDGYIINKVLLYCRRRSLEIANEEITNLIDKNKIDEAESKFVNYKKIVQYTSSGYEPLRDKDLLYKALVEKKDPLFKLSGPLGEFIGPLYRKFFLAIAGPAKRGKSFFMNEFIIQAVKAGLNVAYFSMGDMTPMQIEWRAIQNITARADKAGIYQFPVLDCKWNQNNSCIKPERVSNVGLLVDGKKPKLGEEDKNYKVCTACADKFTPATWLVNRKVKELDYAYAVKTMEKFNRMYRGRFLCYFWPRGVGGISNIKSVLDMWETFNNFVPHVIITDYADIMRPDKYHKNDIDNINHIWEAHDALCKERDVLLITGTHTKRNTFSSDITPEDIATDIRKTHHVNAIISINQTKEEKIEKVARIGYLMARDDDYTNHEFCVVLQQLDVGQFCLNSYLI